MNKPSKIKVIRYVRPKNSMGQAKSHGGKTYAFLIDYVSKKVYYQTARCSEKDNFCRKTGRELALSRLETDPKFGFDFEDKIDSMGLVNYLVSQ